MKKILLTLSVFIAFGVNIMAQTDVTFNINHKLGTADFEMNNTAENNMGHTFNVRRMEYYISQIKIVHDGGVETLAPDVYILANGSEPVAQMLGNFDVTNVEAIKFSVGVETPINHEDPALFPVTHPLGPKAPSMHWGWAAGYRFVAMEGKGGTQLDREFQLHGLGDRNYFETTIDYAATAANGAVSINLDADCARILENIDLRQGVIEHGESGAAATALENFRDFVFSPAGASSSTADLAKIQSFEIFPNPTAANEISINFSSLENTDYQVVVTNLLGQQLQTAAISTGKNTLNLNVPNEGIYMIGLLKDGQILTSKRLIVQ